MAKEKQEADGGIWYDCPVLETGHNSLGEDYMLRHMRKPPRTELEFKCASCGEQHILVLGGQAQ